MAKNKLRRFRELREIDFVLEYPYTKLQQEGFPFRGLWGKTFFRNDHPITLELGCGGGEYTIALAERMPKRSFIGVDRKGARIWQGATEALEKELQNVAFLRTDINLISSFFAPNEVNELWITFPDPMMHKRRRRLVSSFYFEKYRQILSPDGVIRLKTDSPFLYQYTLALLETNGISPLVETSDLYASSPEVLNLAIPDIQTRYEQQWLERGMTIKFVAFQLPRGTERFLEPLCEPPRDDYKSYSRGSQLYLESVRAAEQKSKKV